MLEGRQVLTWLKQNVAEMRLSRQKTLSLLVAGAMQMRGVGVLALGKTLEGPAQVKNKIKQAWRFFRNSNIENLEVSQALFDTIKPVQGRIIVLCDWTDVGKFRQLVFALPRDGRSLPFLSLTVLRKQGTRAMVKSEKQALEHLHDFCGSEREFLAIGDRGFGNGRWLEDIRSLGGSFVQRVAGGLYVSVQGFQGLVSDLPVQRGDKVKDWGRGTLTERHAFPVRLITVFEAGAKEPWVIVTNLMEELPQEIVRLYKRRMWIEGTFRDMKNRNWGLGMAKARLSAPERHDRLFIVLALAYFLLMSFGALAEAMGLSKPLKANTENSRVMTLMRIGYCATMQVTFSIVIAIKALKGLPI